MVLPIISVVLNIFISTIQLNYQTVAGTIKEDPRLMRNYKEIKEKETHVIKSIISKKTIEYIVEKECLETTNGACVPDSEIKEIKIIASSTMEEISTVLKMMKEKYESTLIESSANKESITKIYESYLYGIKKALSEVKLL